MRTKLLAIVKLLLRPPLVYIKKKEDRVVKGQLIIGELCGIKFSVRDKTDTYWYLPISCGFMAAVKHDRHGLGS